MISLGSHRHWQSAAAFSGDSQQWMQIRGQLLFGPEMQLLSVEVYQLQEDSSNQLEQYCRQMMRCCPIVRLVFEQVICACLNAGFFFSHVSVIGDVVVHDHVSQHVTACTSVPDRLSFLWWREETICHY